MWRSDLRLPEFERRVKSWGWGKNKFASPLYFHLKTLYNEFSKSNVREITMKPKRQHRSTHPYAGATIWNNITRQHDLLLWENMLGTLYAHNGKEVRYFDYDWEAARKFAGVDECTDLRGCKKKRHVTYTGDSMEPRVGKYCMWGIRPTEK